MIDSFDLKHIDEVKVAMESYYHIYNELYAIELIESRHSSNYQKYLCYLKLVMFECDQRFMNYSPSKEKAILIIDYLKKQYDLKHPREINEIVQNVINSEEESNKIIYQSIINRLYSRYVNEDNSQFDGIEQALTIFNSEKLSQLYQFEKDNYTLAPRLMSECTKIFLSFNQEDVANCTDSKTKEKLLKTKYDITFTNEIISRMGMNLKFDYRDYTTTLSRNFAIRNNITTNNFEQIKNRLAQDIVSRSIYDLWFVPSSDSSYNLRINWLKTGLVLMNSAGLDKTKENAQTFNKVAQECNSPMPQETISDVYSIIENATQYKKKILI